MEVDLVKMIQDLGVPVGLLVYFAYKDYKFTAKIVDLMARVQAALELNVDSKATTEKGKSA